MNPSRLRSAAFGMFACVGACSTSAPAPSGSTPPDTCTSGNSFCTGFDYTLCVDVAQTPGHCVDWSKLGVATCPRGPADCPTSLPMASFPKDIGSVPIAICISKDKAQYSGGPHGRPDAGPLEAGYCAAFQSALLPGDVASCAPNPCGEKGHCSLVQSGDPSLVVVECMWPL
jgi:hypothetical protein